MKNFFSQFKGLKRRQPHAADAPSIEVQHINLRYNGGYALKDINFRLEPSNRIAVVGPNGAGKSTLMNILVGIYQPNAGEIRIRGEQDATTTRSRPSSSDSGRPGTATT